jgi:CheY-like chemotaxis protein
VQIYSEPGLGTTVSVWLPVTSEHATDAGPQGTPAPASGRGETVLLAEDEESLRELARRILIRHGYQVCVATTAPDAIKRASDLGQRFDLLLTDVVMPEMLGNEVADRIHAIRPGLPVLYMSGYAQQVLDTQGALESGVDLLEKPFTEDTLLTRVRQAIDHVRQPGGR